MNLFDVKKLIPRKGFYGNKAALIEPPHKAALIEPPLAINDPSGQIQAIGADTQPATYPAQMTVSDLPDKYKSFPIIEPPVQAVNDNMSGQIQPPAVQFPVIEDAPPASLIGARAKVDTNAAIPETMRPPSQPMPIIQPPMSPEERMNQIANKDYSKAKYDEQGNLIKAAGADRDKKWSTLDKIGSALMGFANGGIVGAVQAGTNRNYFEKQKDQMEMGRLAPLAERRALLEKRKMEREKHKSLLETAIVKRNADVLDTVRKKNKPLYDSVLADDLITPEESEMLKKAGYEVEPYDARQYKYIDREGETYRAPTKGSKPFETTNLPTDRIKVPVEITQTNPDGTTTKLPMLPQPAANFGYRGQKDIADADAKQRELDHKETVEGYKEDAGYEKEGFKSVADWQKAMTTARGKVVKNKKLLTGLDTSIAELDAKIQKYGADNYDVSDLQRQKSALEQKRATYDGEISAANETLKIPKPTVFKPSTSRPTRGNSRRKKNYSASDIDSIIRQ